MQPLILSVLLQSVARGANDLKCGGLVIRDTYESDDGQYTSEWEYGYAAGVCWSWAKDESVILQCDDNGITVIEYPNDDCSDDDWQVSYPTNGCVTWGDGIFYIHIFNLLCVVICTFIINLIP